MFEDHCAKLRMVSPTRQGIRNDSQGHGHYRAKRGKGRHKGTDYVCRPGQEIYAPISGKIKRIAKPYAKENFEGVVLENEFLTLKLFYFKPHSDLIGQLVLQGQPIGVAQDISKKYLNMIPHIHVECEAIDVNLFVRR